MRTVSAKEQESSNSPQSFQTLVGLTTDWHLGRADTCSNSYWCVVEVYPAGGVKDHGGKTLPTEVPTPVSSPFLHRVESHATLVMHSDSYQDAIDGRRGKWISEEWHLYNADWHFNLELIRSNEILAKDGFCILQFEIWETTKYSGMDVV